MQKLFLILAFMLVCGCSSFQAVKLDSSGRIPKGVKAGNITTLPRPEFVVKKVEGSDPEQYQVGVTYVPDITERYAIRMASSPFASIDLNLVYGDNGALSSTSATVKDQAAPTLLGLFKVASSAAVAFGTGGAFSLKTPTAYDDCFELSDKSITARRARCAIALNAGTAECSPVASELDRRLGYYVKPDGTDKAPGILSLLARDDKEKRCLAKVRDALHTHLTTSATASPDKFYTMVETAFDADNDIPPADGVPPKTGDLVRDAILDAVKKNIMAGNAEGMKRLAYVADAAVDERGLARFGKLLGGTVNPKIEDAARLKRVLRADAIKIFPDDTDAADHAGLNRIRTIGDIDAGKKAIEAALALDPQTWRSRYVASLQMDVIQREVELLAAAPATNVQSHPDILALREKIASLAGVRSEYDRAQSFRRLLDRMPPPSTGERLSPAIEYEEYRKQVAALDLRVNEAIATALTASTKADKPAPLPPQAPWVGEQCIKDSKSEKWRHTEGIDAPRFVVVLRRADGTALTPRDNGSGICGA